MLCVFQAKCPTGPVACDETPQRLPPRCVCPVGPCRGQHLPACTRHHILVRRGTNLKRGDTGRMTQPMPENNALSTFPFKTTPGLTTPITRPPRVNPQTRQNDAIRHHGAPSCGHTNPFNEAPPCGHPNMQQQRTQTRGLLMCHTLGSSRTGSPRCLPEPASPVARLLPPSAAAPAARCSDSCARNNGSCR